MNVKKRHLVFGIFFLALALAFVLNVHKVEAVGEAVVCCEKTTSGAWCQEVTNEANCNPSFRSAPTSCESTSYCKLGTCVNTIDGICMENTAQKVCETPVGGVAAGIWHDAEVNEVPQCQLGCCLLGDQASFTTQTRCKQLSSEFGLETNYRTDIKSEVECIASASPQAKGACVFEDEFQTTCRFVTKKECQDLQSTSSGDAEFHPGFLCSAASLGTNCGPSKKTTIVDGRDEVFFMDTCGNPANIYDSGRQDDAEYWDKIVPKSESCTLNGDLNNANACGNCNYLLGSIGKLYERGVDPKAPTYGDYVCKDLSCGEVDGDTRDHGETWCVNPADSGNENNPGAKYFRKVCYNGEVTVEPCADFRAETCIEDSIGDFSTAACRVNMWQDCTAQDNQKDCENIDRRDCEWISGDRFDGQNTGDAERQGKCVPTNPPGFDFWSPDSDASSVCVQANLNCLARFEKGVLGAEIDLGIVNTGPADYECVNGDGSNCDCIGGEGTKLGEINVEGSSWTTQANNICSALGDCGIVVNYVGDEGYNTFGDLVTYKKAENQDEGLL